MERHIPPAPVSSQSSTASCTIWYSLFLLSINRNLQRVKTTNLLYVPYLILAIRHQTQCRCYLHKQTQLSEKRLFSTTKCCIPARKSGKSENSPKALSVIVGLEVDDAETIGKPHWDGIGPGFVWTNTFRDYSVCQSTATCFRLFKHWGCFSLKLHRNEKKGENQTQLPHVENVHLEEWYIAWSRGMLHVWERRVKKNQLRKIE